MSLTRPTPPSPIRTLGDPPRLGGDEGRRRRIARLIAKHACAGMYQAEIVVERRWPSYLPLAATILSIASEKSNV